MIYFDNAATTFPKPIEVISGMTECMQKFCGNPGRSAHPLALAAAEAVYNTRKDISAFFSSSKPEHVIFTQNATHALNLAIFGIAGCGDHILISNLEHNSVLRPVHELYRRGIASYSIFGALGDDEETLENIKRSLRRNTRLIITTHVSNVCPKKLPIEKIAAFCRERNICYIVDVSQSAGIFDIDMSCGITVLCAPGHKGLYGPQGSGFCLFSDDFNFKKLAPLTFGGNGVNSAKADMGNIQPESFEAGTLSVPNIVGLQNGLRFVSKKTTSVILNHEKNICKAIKERLMQDERIKIYLPHENASPTVLFNAKGITASELAASLAKKGVCTRAGLHCSPLAHKALDTGGDAVRLSFSAFNNIREAEGFLSILYECLK